jgi:hypothetical protein
MTRRPLARTAPLLVALCALITQATPAVAHAGFAGGEVTEFAMPLWVVYFAGALTVALSFALVGAFLSREEEQRAIYQTQRQERSTAAAGTRWTPLRILSAALLVLVILNSLVTGPTGRLPAVYLWLILWVVLPLVAYTLGDPWPRLSPFAPLLRFTAALRGGAPPRPYPHSWGLWPAVLLMLLLIALEIGDHPMTRRGDILALGVLAYVLLTLIGMIRYGQHWLDHAEVIGRMMNAWGAVSPLRWQSGRPRYRGLQGIQEISTARMDTVAFLIAVLYGVNHDVFLHTPTGQQALATLTWMGIPAPSVLLLAAGYLFFLLVWILAARSMRQRSESLRGVRATAGLFVASLLPIAAAYHLAHNIPYLYQTLPLLLSSLRDPLGLGWAGGVITRPLAISSEILPTLAGATIALIILGHLVAVLAAHRLAFGAHPSRVQAVRAEIPLTLVMVLYTGIGLALLGAKGGGVA